jgi:hypothetical protein
MNKIMKLAFCSLLTVLAMTSCSTFSDDSDPYGGTEAAKDLSGVWKLKTVTRNSIDITSLMDFSKFTLNLNSDGTYTIDNYLPFIVRESGTWAIDNPQYPFLISFKESSANASVDVELSYPVVNGRRALSITHSPGCYTNTYTYTLERVSTNQLP